MNVTQIAKFMRPTWSPPGSCRPQIDPMLALNLATRGGIYIPQGKPTAHRWKITKDPTTGRDNNKPKTNGDSWSGKPINYLKTINVSGMKGKIRSLSQPTKNMISIALTAIASIQKHGTANIWPWYLKWLDHSAWIWRSGVPVPLRSGHFLSQNLWHFHKNTCSCVENECSCLCTVNISNVNVEKKEE